MSTGLGFMVWGVGFRALLLRAQGLKVLLGLGADSEVARFKVWGRRHVANI